MRKDAIRERYTELTSEFQSRLGMRLSRIVDFVTNRQATKGTTDELITADAIQ